MMTDVFIFKRTVSLRGNFMLGKAPGLPHNATAIFHKDTHILAAYESLCKACLRREKP